MYLSYLDEHIQAFFLHQRTACSFVLNILGIMIFNKVLQSSLCFLNMSWYLCKLSNILIKYSKLLMLTASLTLKINKPNLQTR